MKGQSLIPEDISISQTEEFIRLVKNSVGKILAVQNNAEAMLKGMREERDPPGPLTHEEMEQWRELRRENIQTQRWSDGLVHFAYLGDTPPAQQINSIFSQLCLAGSTCLVGLAAKAPIRGGMDIAWGIELHPNEIYGPAVANAYHQENSCAQFPRIAVGITLLEFLHHKSSLKSRDIGDQMAGKIADLCLGLIANDATGQAYVHYLSPKFEKAVTHAHIKQLWKQARIFIQEQLELHMRNKCDRLVERYEKLLEYFDSNVPASIRQR